MSSKGDLSLLSGLNQAFLLSHVLRLKTISVLSMLPGTKSV